MNNPIKATPTSPTTPTPRAYERQIAHVAEIKFINERYVTPVTAEFDSSESDNYVYLSVKHRKLFAALKLLDSTLSITISDTTINYLGEFPMGTITYT